MDLNIFKDNFPTITTLYIQESAFDDFLNEEENEADENLEALHDAYRLIEHLKRVFPMLETLIFDWNIVEPYTEASIITIQKLVGWLK